MAQRGPRRQDTPETPPSPQRHQRVAFLAFSRASIVSKRYKFLENPESLSDHLRKRRFESGRGQSVVAAALGVSPSAYSAWERGCDVPHAHHWPSLIAYLGFDPSPPPETPGEQLAAKRRALGLTQEELAVLLDVDPGTIWKWEVDRRRPTRGRDRAAIDRLLASEIEARGEA